MILYSQSKTKDYSSYERPLHQHQIIDLLADRSYEIGVERKAIGRVLHSLADANLGIENDKKLGSWYKWGDFDE